LAAFTRILEVELLTAKGADSLRRAVESINGMVDLVLVDSPGVNPFKQSDMEFLQELIESADVEPVLVMAAGGDPVEAGEMGEAFAQVGVSRLFASKLDTTRRLGAILVAAEVGGLALSDVSASPHVASGVAPISALSLAQLLIPDTTPPEQKAEQVAASALAAAVAAAEAMSPIIDPNPQKPTPHWTDEAYSP
jgi:flagellar biosynthesis protein FlhF